MRLTRRGKIVVAIAWLIAVAVLSSVPALWWTDNPIPIH